MAYMDNANTEGNASSLVVLPRSGRMFGLVGFNAGPEQFIQIHDSVDIPEEGSVPVISMKIPTEQSFSLDFGLNGRHFENGIVVCNSSTQDTKTIGSENCQIDVQYRQD